MLETYLVFAVAIGAIVLATILWWRGRRVVRAEQRNFCNSGLTTKQWYAMAQLLERIAHELSSQETKRDQWRSAFLALAPEIRQSPAGLELDRFLVQSHPESLDLAVQALVPGADNPWLLISKSL